MNILDLFSGIGGFSLGLQRAGMETVAFCEIDPYCQQVLRKHWPDKPIYTDIKKLTKERLEADGITKIDLITAGFPCQDISDAKRDPAGLTGQRSGLFWEALRTIRMVRPPLVLLENVAALRRRGMGEVLGSLAESGYDSEWDSIQARHVGAPHKRERVFILAYLGCYGIQGILPQSIQRQPAFSWYQNVRGVEDLRNRPDLPEPLVWRNSDGFSHRVDRLRGLGNAVLPQIAEIIGMAIQDGSQYDQHCEE